MTQDVQPLTWQKRTNLEEHQQFFSKINEIIDNLAPTVDEAEQAIAQATQALTDATAAIATANAASAAADAAAQSAQASAATVAGYNTRLTAVEGEADTNADNITALQGRMGTAEGNITALQNVQADYVKKAGAAQTVTSQIMVPTTATGTRDTQIANGTRIQNDLAAYEPMIRNTGNQEGLGIKRFPDMCRLPSILTAGTAGNYNSLYAVTVDQNAIYGVFEIYDRTNNAYGVYAGIFRSHNITFTKLYGTLPENGMAVALNTARDKMYVFVKAARTTADVRFCVHAWNTNHVAAIVAADNTISETDETLVAGSTYYAVIKV